MSGLRWSTLSHPYNIFIAITLVLAVSAKVHSQSLGDLGAVSTDKNTEGSDKAKPVQQVSGLIEKTFSVTDPNVLYTIKATADDYIGFRLGLIKAHDKALVKNLIHDKRHFGLNQQPLQLSNVALPVGQYKVLVRPDSKANITISIEKSLPPKVVQIKQGSRKSPIILAKDIVGSDGDFFLKPKGLTADSISNVVLSFSSGSANLNIVNEKGEVFETRKGKSPINITAIKGDNWLIRVAKNPYSRDSKEASWRLKLDQTKDNYDILDGGTDNFIEQFPSHREGLKGRLDSNDTDRFTIGQGNSSKSPFYYLSYKGPLAKIIIRDGLKSQTQKSHNARLGPFRTSKTLEFEVSSEKSSSGDYQLVYTSFNSNKAIAEEPDNPSIRFSTKQRVSGSLSHREDRDLISFDLGDKAQMFRPMILGKNISDIRVYSAYDQYFRHRRNITPHTKRRFPAPDLYLGPGPVTIELAGQKGDYKVFMKPLGKPLENGEREPNQDNFSRRIEFGKHYIGTLPEQDRDKYSFFAEKPATVAVKLFIPAGGFYKMSHAVNGSENKDVKFFRKELSGTQDLVIKVRPGENTLTLKPVIPSPAEYHIQLDYLPPFPANETAQQLEFAMQPVKAFSTVAQSIEIPSSSGISLDRSLKLWSPAGKISLLKTAPRIVIAPDLSSGLYPIWISDGSKTVRTILQALPEAPDLNPEAYDPIPPAWQGGINVASAALGAEWLDQAGYELDKDSKLPRKNKSNAQNIQALNDGVRALSDDVGFFHTFSKHSEHTYNPVLKLAGDKPQIIGFALTNRILKSNNFREFIVDASLDKINWQQVLHSELTSWSERQFFSLPNGPTEAQYIRLRPLKNDGSKQSLLLAEFEVFAKPGSAGMGMINLNTMNIGSAGRYIGGKTHNRHIGYGLQATNKAKRLDIKKGISHSGLTHSFKNNGIAEVEAVEFFFGDSLKGGKYPEYARIQGSVSGPNGPFNHQMDLELPKNIKPNSSARITLPERLIANAVRIEYGHNNPAVKTVQSPAYYHLYERQEGPNYQSVLGLAAEYSPRPYNKGSGQAPKPIPYSGSGTLLAINGKPHSGVVKLKILENSWLVKPENNENTLVLTVQGERGFFPRVEAKNSTGKAVEALKIEKNETTAQSTWHFDLPASGLSIHISEPARSTVFLMDQSPSATRYIGRARRSVIEYAEKMVAGEDRVLFAALGRGWLSKEWISDPIVLQRKLTQYSTAGNSDGEKAITQAAKRLKAVSGSRSIVILTDGDVSSPRGDIFSELAASNARVFPIKISSAKIWGNPASALTVMSQWSQVSGGEFAYILQDKDITDAYARVTARLLGEKSYTLFAKGEKRVLKPGQLLVEAKTSDNTANDKIRNYHVLFDASGSMLKRKGKARRYQIARDALIDFTQQMLAEHQGIGLRTFGGAPDSCETKLVFDPDVTKRDAFIKTVSAIQPQNNAKTPIAQALSQLPKDLADKEGPIQVLLITDGEETCDGDAGEVIDRLVNSEIAERIDIVSFALKPEIDRASFKDWAKRGRGVYIDAQDKASLAEALRQTVKRRFEVLQGENIVASSQLDGKPVELEPGDYTVKIDGEVYPVSIRADKLVRLSVE